MTEIAVKTQQQSDSISSDGNTITVAGDRERALFTGDINSKYMQWLLAGKVFEAHQADVATAVTLEANATYDPLEPMFSMLIPASITVVPIFFELQFSAAHTAFDRLVMTAHDTDTTSSGGLATSGAASLFIDNQGAGNPVTSAVTLLDGDTAMTEAAATNLRQIWSKIVIGTGDIIPPFNALKGDPTCAISGPAKLLVGGDVGAAEEVFYHAIWAELDKNYLVNR